MNPVKQLYLDRLEAASNVVGQEDMLALDQNEVGTKVRHAEVARHVSPKSTILDLGAGTGLLLDELNLYGKLPMTHFAVDMMEERLPPLMERWAKYRINGLFMKTDPDTPFYENVALDMIHPHTLVAVGICGYHGLHTIRRVKKFMDWAVKKAPEGVVTFPMQYGNVVGNGDRKSVV